MSDPSRWQSVTRRHRPMIPAQRFLAVCQACNRIFQQSPSMLTLKCLHCGEGENLTLTCAQPAHEPEIWEILWGPKP